MPGAKSIGEKVIIVSTIVTGVGFGLCSFGAVGAARWANFAVPVGAMMFFVGLAVLVVTGLVMLVRALMRSGR